MQDQFGRKRRPDPREETSAHSSADLSDAAREARILIQVIEKLDRFSSDARIAQERADARHNEFVLAMTKETQSTRHAVNNLAQRFEVVEIERRDSGKHWPRFLVQVLAQVLCGVLVAALVAGIVYKTVKP
jgi:hypothetical protein